MTKSVNNCVKLVIIFKSKLFDFFLSFPDTVRKIPHPHPCNIDCGGHHEHLETSVTKVNYVF